MSDALEELLAARLHTLGETVGDEIPAPAQPREERRPRDGGRPSRRGAGGMTRLFIGAGRYAGVGPRDLVGAIAHEAGLTGRDIGAIDVTDRFSLVEVPEEAAEHVIESLRAARIKGRKVTVRRDRTG